jgi:aspartate racemase
LYAYIFMKTLGVIGGMGPQASIQFLDLVVQRCTKDFGVCKNDEFPRMLLSSLPAPDIIENRNSEKRAGEMLAEESRRLEQAGADFLVMTCNTMHVLAECCVSSVSIPFVSIIETVVSQAKEEGITKIGLLGSRTTMTSDLYVSPLNTQGIEVLVPKERQQEEVVRCILSTIAGTAGDRERQSLKEEVENLSSAGAEAVILGCTELPLLIDQTMTNIPLLDSLQLLADASCREIFT